MRARQCYACISTFAANGSARCVVLADNAPPPVNAAVVSGANGDVDVYGDDTQVLERPKVTDKFFSWGPPPPPKAPDESAPSVEQYRKVIKGKGGGLPPTKQEVAAATSVNEID